jgi:hypothetical protein
MQAVELFVPEPRHVPPGLAVCFCPLRNTALCHGEEAIEFYAQGVGAGPPIRVMRLAQRPVRSNPSSCPGQQSFGAVCATNVLSLIGRTIYDVALVHIIGRIGK